jgi:peptidoglycan/LPS O-acetylase OafA/YrhL
VPWRNQLDNLRPAFTNPILRWVGKYSYAIYIFHFPIKHIWFHYFALTVPPNAPWYRLGVVSYNFVGITAIAIVAAYISWYLIEQPFLTLKRYFVLKQTPRVA